MRNGNLPASPQAIAVNSSTGDVISGSEWIHTDYQGLTKREEFAKAAMQGLCTRKGTWVIAECAGEAVEHADALLKALEESANA